MKSDNINQAMQESGFELRATGNDCSAFQKNLAQLFMSNGSSTELFLMITSHDDLSAPDSMTDLVTLGLYHRSNKAADFSIILMHKVTVSEALTFCDQMKQVGPV